MEMPSFKSGYASVHGLQMYYEIHGSGGTPLVLVHGGGSTIQTSFAQILPFFAKTRTVIAMDLQVHGRTSDRPGPTSFEQDADDVAALLAHLSIPQADFLGFSNGGNTCMQVCIRHPQLVRKLVAISAFYQRGGMASGFFEFMAHASLDNMPMPLQQAFLDVAPDRSLLVSMHNKDRDRMIHFEDWPDAALQNIQADTLLVVGDRDVVTVPHTLDMARLIPGARLLVVPGAHGACIGELCAAVAGSSVPQLTAAMILEFLDKAI